MFNWTSISDITDFIIKIGAAGIAFHLVMKKLRHSN